MPTLKEKMDELLALLKSGRVIVIQPGTGASKAKTKKAQLGANMLASVIKSNAKRKK